MLNALTVSDVDYRQTDGDTLLMRLYQPQGPGPFPAVLDVHGGNWNSGDRTANQLIARGLAGAGIVVAAPDFRLSPPHPYPAQIIDVDYAAHWLKAHASELHILPERLGALGDSSGGHTALLLGLRPDGLANSLAPDGDASLAFVLPIYPILDPHVRYLTARQNGREDRARSVMDYFQTEKVMQAAGPAGIVERGEHRTSPSILIIQGTADEGIPPDTIERFVAVYRAAGGPVEVEWFTGAAHMFCRNESPDTERAILRMANFIAQGPSRYSGEAARP